MTSAGGLLAAPFGFFKRKPTPTTPYRAVFSELSMPLAEFEETVGVLLKNAQADTDLIRLIVGCLRLRRGFKLPPGASTEEVAEQDSVMSFSLISALVVEYYFARFGGSRKSRTSCS